MNFSRYFTVRRKGSLWLLTGFLGFIFNGVLIWPDGSWATCISPEGLHEKMPSGRNFSEYRAEQWRVREPLVIITTHQLFIRDLDMNVAVYVAVYRENWDRKAYAYKYHKAGTSLFTRLTKFAPSFQTCNLEPGARGQCYTTDSPSSIYEKLNFCWHCTICLFTRVCIGRETEPKIAKS